MEHYQIYHQLWISAAMIAATTFVHGSFVAIAAVFFRAARGNARGIIRFFRDSFVLVLVVLWLMVAHAIEIAMWGWVYMRYAIFDQWEMSLYFAASSYTTLGFGDVLAPIAWRLLSGATAANGLLLFGLSAAFLFETTRRLNLADPQYG
ncbi:MAG: hypothetical protein GXP04_06980 [Alphaproteobacteria bacterium]|nr:hypothetical protein [Alphaproteobacteria bacterium]